MKRSHKSMKRAAVSERWEDVAPKCTAEPAVSLLQSQSPDTLFASLIAPVTTEQFFTEHWERTPLHLSRQQRDDAGVASYFSSLFSLSDLPDLCSRHALLYGRDVNVVRCVNGKKKVLNGDGKVRSAELLKLITKNKATVQFHQPQRFKDALWQIQEKLESFFGGLVGSNVYMTPADSQGLPAHYDDVEVFILQLEGQKHWRLYSPTVPLAGDYSLVPKEQLGNPTHDIILQEGDLLYFPRGTIHQAKTLPTDHSTHLTISTFQKMSWADFLLDSFPGLLSDSSKMDLCLRQGLPRRFLMGGFKMDKARRQLASELRRLADRIEQHSGEISSAGLKRDFITNRLPPSCPQEQLEPEGRPPTLQDTVCLTFREHMLLSLEPTHRTTDEAPETAVFVLHSLRNQRRSHMMCEETEEEPHVSSGLQFPLSHMEALQQLQQEEQVSVRDLRLSRPEEQLSLVVALWSESLLKVL